MDINAQKEEFSYGYLQLLGAKAGLEVTKSGRQTDNQKIDLHIIHSGKISNIYTPRFDAQVKCTHKENIDNGYFKYDLDIETYDRLRNIYHDVPIFLIVLLVPKDINNWVQITQEKLVVKKCAYYISLKGFPKSTNTKTVRIKIPIKNLVTPSSLNDIITDIAEQRKKLIEKIYQGGKNEF